MVASSASTGVVTYSVLSGPAFLSGSILSVTGAGTVALTASQAADANYAASTATSSFTVATKTPTLTFLPVGPRTYGDTAFTVSATSSSPGAVTYSVISGPATISGGVLTLTGSGSVTLQASQAATLNYSTATASTSFMVAAANPSLTFGSIPARTYGDPAFSVAATSASPGAVSYAVLSGPATVAGSSVTVTGTGTVVLSATQAATANYSSATATTSFNVAAAQS